MKAQEQKQPMAHTPFDERDEPRTASKSAPKTAPKKSGAGRIFAVIGIVTACFLCTAFGVMARGSTTLFLEKRTMDGYLSPEEYMLVNRQTGEMVQNVRSLNIKTMNSWEGEGLMTSRGIQEGSSWEEFTDAYSDIHVKSISYYKNTPDLYSINYAEGIYLTDPITVAEFSQKYCQSGEINPETDRIYISFQLYTDGFHLYYSDKELRDGIDKYYETPELLQPVTPYPRTSSFELSFAFSPDQGVEYITSRYY